MRRFGKNYGKIADLIKTKDYSQVNSRIYRYHEQYPEVKIKRVVPWTDKEMRAFANVVKKVGMNTKMLEKAFPNRKITEDLVYRFTKHLREQIENDPKHKYAYLYNSLFYNNEVWNPEEDLLMLNWLKTKPPNTVNHIKELDRVLMTKTYS